jgi:hypothetical protein
VAVMPQGRNDGFLENIDSIEVQKKKRSIKGEDFEVEAKGVALASASASWYGMAWHGTL